MPVFLQRTTNFDIEFNYSPLTIRVKTSFPPWDLNDYVTKKFSQQDYHEIKDIIENIDHYNVYCVGDLHGNFFKLLSVLVHLGFITFKTSQPLHTNSDLAQELIQQDLHSYLQENDKSKGYLLLCRFYDNLKKKFHEDLQSFTHHNQKNQFSSAFQLPECLYNSKLSANNPKNQAPHIKYKIIQFLIDIFQINEIQKNTKEIVFIGDTICDRGISDFVTLCVFDWMQANEFHYKIVLGNHDLKIFLCNLFHQGPLEHDFFYPDHKDFMYFRSFDYWRYDYIKGWRYTFKSMYKLAWLSCMSIYLNYFEYPGNYRIFLSHAPAYKGVAVEMFTQLRRLIASRFNGMRLNDDQDINNCIRKIFFCMIEKDFITQNIHSCILQSLEPPVQISYQSHLEPTIKTLCNFCEQHLLQPWELAIRSDSTTCYLGDPNARLNTPNISPKIDQKFETSFGTSNTYTDRLNKINVFRHHGDCHVFAHLADTVIRPPNFFRFCIDSSFGMWDDYWGSTSRNVRYALIKTESKKASQHPPFRMRSKSIHSFEIPRAAPRLIRNMV